MHIFSGKRKSMEFYSSEAWRIHYKNLNLREPSTGEDRR
jgi:hypothetical protein